MSLDIPFEIEHKIMQFAEQQHITPGEAVIRLIETGLANKKSKQQKPCSREG